MLNNKQVKKGNLITAVILVVVVIIILPVAIGALVSGVWFFGLPLIAACLLISWSIFKKIKEYRKADRILPNFKNIILPHAPDQVANANSVILGEWQIHADDWKQFIITEKKLRNEDSVYLFIGTIIMGTIGLISARNMHVITALFFAVVIGLIVVLLRRYFALKNLQVKTNTNCKIIITPVSVFINSQIYSLFDSNRYLRKVQIIKKQNQHFLEFTIGWNTRKGPTFDELRIPVPAINFVQAETILNYFNKTQ